MSGGLKTKVACAIYYAGFLTIAAPDDLTSTSSHIPSHT